MRLPEPVAYVNLKNWEDGRYTERQECFAHEPYCEGMTALYTEEQVRQIINKAIDEMASH